MLKKIWSWLTRGSHKWNYHIGGRFNPYRRVCTICNELQCVECSVRSMPGGKIKLYDNEWVVYEDGDASKHL